MSSHTHPSYLENPHQSLSQTCTVVRLCSVLNVFLYMHVHLIWRRGKENHQSLGYICMVIWLYSVLNVFLYMPGEGSHASGLQRTDRPLQAPSGHSKHHLTHTCAHSPPVASIPKVRSCDVQEQDIHVHHIGKPHIKASASGLHRHQVVLGIERLPVHIHLI